MYHRWCCYSIHCCDYYDCCELFRVVFVYVVCPCVFRIVGAVVGVDVAVIDLVVVDTGYVGCDVVCV